MKLRISEPVIISRGPSYAEAGWGPYQFPHLYRLDDGRILCCFADSSDTIDAYGAERKAFVSADNGKTWEQVKERDFLNKFGVRLDDGDLINFFEQDSIRITEDMHFPEPAGTSKGMNYYHVEELDDSICAKSWILHRVNKEHPEGVDEPVTLNWPNKTVAAGKGIVIPVQPWGELRKAPDGSLWMPDYGVGLNPRNGGFSPYSSNYTLRSLDGGRTWDLMDFAGYVPDTDVYKYAFQCEGFTEQDIGFAPDGTYFRISRTNGTGPIVIGPTYISFSQDKGVTWSKPEQFDDRGVWPQIITLKCGVSLCSYGRPGFFVRATADPSCRKWEDRIELIHCPEGESPWQTGCSYSSWIEIDDHTAGLAFSNFRIPDETGKLRKTMLFCTVSVEM